MFNSESSANEQVVKALDLNGGDLYFRVRGRDGVLGDGRE